MIIANVKKIRTVDVPKYTWSRIAQFQNTDHTTDVLTQLHGLSQKERPNAKRQAEQIKHCLAQAKEYFDAARAVSLATQPVLLYYSIMSLALAEILLKQTAESRLSKLREKHNCHGLQLVVEADPKPADVLGKAAILLRAKAQKDPTDNPKGTFEVWRRSAREYPIGAYHKVTFPNGTTQTSFTLIMGAVDTPPPLLPKGGLSLLDCLCELPYMSDVLSALGTRLNMVRAAVRSEQVDYQGIPTLTAILHPTDQTLLDKFGSLVRAPAAAVNYLNITEMRSGYLISFSADREKPAIYSWPHSICLTDEDLYFSCSEVNLGEFGFIYVALHICGNFARYYPDLWLNHIEKNSPLAMAIGELCNHALERAPLLSLSELLRVYHVAEK